jgi:hypothetical protein
MTDRPPVSGEPRHYEGDGIEPCDNCGNGRELHYAFDGILWCGWLPLTSGEPNRNPYQFGAPGYDAWEQGWAEARATPPLDARTVGIALWAAEDVKRYGVGFDGWWNDGGNRRMAERVHAYLVAPEEPTDDH